MLRCSSERYSCLSPEADTGCRYVCPRRTQLSYYFEIEKHVAPLLGSRAKNQRQSSPLIDFSTWRFLFYFPDSLEKVEDASAQHEADDRLEQLEADISRLREERAELAAAHGSAVRELEAQVSAGEEALRVAKRQVAKLEDDIGSLSTAAERARRKERAAEEAVAAAEDGHLAAEAGLADAERRLAEAIKAVRFMSIVFR